MNTKIKFTTQPSPDTSAFEFFLCDLIAHRRPTRKVTTTAGIRNLVYVAVKNSEKDTKVNTNAKFTTRSTSDDSAFEFSDVLGIPGFCSSGESPLFSPTPVSMGAPL